MRKFIKTKPKRLISVFLALLILLSTILIISRLTITDTSLSQMLTSKKNLKWRKSQLRKLNENKSALSKSQKKESRVLAVITAFVLCFCVSITAFADNEALNAVNNLSTLTPLPFYTGGNYEKGYLCNYTCCADRNICGQHIFIYIRIFA